MAEPKGVYYGSGERGWATVLPAGPDLRGLAAARGRQAAAKKADDSLKKQQARDAAVKDAFSALSGPADTHAFYQPILNEKVNESISGLQQMILEERPVADIRAYAAKTAQDITSYRTAGKQVWNNVEAMMTWNKDNGSIFDESKMKEYLVSNVLLDKEGKKFDPVSVFQNGGFNDPESYIYNNPNGNYAGAQLLNAGQVVRNLLQTDAMKAAVSESATRRATKGATTISQMDVGTQATYRPFATISSNGEIKIMDAEKLVESGLLGVVLDYKPFAQLIEGDLEKAAEGMTPEEREVFLSDEDAQDSVRANAAIQRLTGYEKGGSKVRKINYQNLRNIGTGRGGSKTAQQTTEFWSKAVSEGNPVQFNDALQYITQHISTTNGLEGAIAAIEALDSASRIISDSRILSNTGKITFTRDSNDSDIVLINIYNGAATEIKESVPIKRSEFATSNPILNLYRQALSSLKRPFATTETGKIPGTTTSDLEMAVTPKQLPVRVPSSVEAAASSTQPLFEDEGIFDNLGNNTPSLTPPKK